MNIGVFNVLIEKFFFDLAGGMVNCGVLICKNNEDNVPASGRGIEYLYIGGYRIDGEIGNAGGDRENF